MHICITVVKTVIKLENEAMNFNLNYLAYLAVLVPIGNKIPNADPEANNFFSLAGAS